MFGKKRKELQKEARELIEMYEKRTAAISKEKAMDLLDTEESWDFASLLKIAESQPLGKSKAILYAFRLGYLAGNQTLEQDTAPNHKA